jgi:hypothetical protein
MVPLPKNVVSDYPTIVPHTDYGPLVEDFEVLISSMTERKDLGFPCW